MIGVVRYFFAVILCFGAYGILFPSELEPIKGTPASYTKIFSKNFTAGNSSENSTISATKTHNFSRFLQSLLLCEVEQTDDEDEASDFHDEQGNLSGIDNETTLVDFLRQSDHVSSVPLFIFLHSWRYFLL
jgi:hypothetical protein